MRDEEYVLRARNGDDAACEYILNKYKPMVRSISRAYFLLGGDREDVVQEGMIGLYRAVCTYHSPSETDSAQEGAGFETYANICVRRQIYSAIKAAARQKHMPLNDYISLNSGADASSIEAAGSQEPLTGQMNPEEIIINREARDILREKINGKLSKFEKNVLEQYLKGGTYEEIGMLLGKESKSIDNALQRIKKKLKEVGA